MPGEGLAPETAYVRRQWTMWTTKGHVEFGVKWEILPLCLKGKFYANHAFVHKGKILRQGCRCVHNDSILRHRIWRKIPL